MFLFGDDVGYTTDFEGRAQLLGNIPDGMIDFVNAIAVTRRMKRNVDKKFGIEGEYYTLGGGSFGQDKEPNVIDQNTPPSSQPSLWCQWKIVSETLSIRKSIVDETQVLTTNHFIQWDGGEKFYEYVPWMNYLIEKVFYPYRIFLSGVIRWEGEDRDDVGEICLIYNDKERQVLEADGHGHFSYIPEYSFPKLNFLDLLRKDKQIEFVF